MKIQYTFPKLYPSLLVGFLLFTVQAVTAQIPSDRGSLLISDVEGTVSIVNNTNNSTVSATAGTSFSDGHTIRTGANSSVILILSNGATLFIGPNSAVNIETFSQTLASESSDQSRRPLNELEREIGISNISIQMLGGTIYLDTQPMNEGSSISVRDENVTTYPATSGGAYAQYFQRERSRSTVEVVQGNVTTQGSQETSPTMRESGIFHFENGSAIDTSSQSFDESFVTEAFIQRMTQARQSSISGEGSPDSGEGNPNREGNINNIKDANERIYTNPVTGEEVFTPGNPVNPPADDIISIVE